LDSPLCNLRITQQVKEKTLTVTKKSIIRVKSTTLLDTLGEDYLLGQLNNNLRKQINHNKA